MPDSTTDTPSYAAMHGRINHRLGRARRHDCVDCGQPARDWSYDHADPEELTSPTGLEYSTKPEHYEPRCKRCHRRFDEKYRKSGIPRLHALAAELEPQIRAVAKERERARHYGDVEKMIRLDIELDRLTAPLQTPRADHAKRPA